MVKLTSKGGRVIQPIIPELPVIVPKKPKAPRAPSIPRTKLRLDNGKFQNGLLKYLKTLDLEDFPANNTMLKQYKKYGKKTMFVEILSLAQDYIDSAQYKIDKKN